MYEMEIRPKTPEVAFTILTYKSSFIFQHRDYNPDIVSPGLYAGFGGKTA